MANDERWTCEICQKNFKSNSGLQGHRQLAHQLVMKRELPSNEMLAINLETALDEVGQLRESLSESLGGILKALQVIQEQQKGLAGTLRHEALKPTSMLLNHWGHCEECEKELALLQNQLAGLVLAPTPPPAPAEPTRWRKESRYPWDTAETTDDEAVAQQWRAAGDNVEEVKLPATPPPEAPVEKPTKWPWE